MTVPFITRIRNSRRPVLRAMWSIKAAFRLSRCETRPALNATATFQRALALHISFARFSHSRAIPSSRLCAIILATRAASSSITKCILQRTLSAPQGVASILRATTVIAPARRAARGLTVRRASRPSPSPEARNTLLSLLRCRAASTRRPPCKNAPSSLTWLRRLTRTLVFRATLCNSTPDLPMLSRTTNPKLCTRS